LLFFYAASAAAAPSLEGSPNRKETAADTSAAYQDPTNGLGSWIWAATTTNEQTCHFWRSFEIPASATVKQARLCMTVDNEFSVFLDGRELGRGAEWRELFIFDLKPLMSPGRHVLAVRGFNSTGYAGMLLGLRVELADERRIEIQSDPSWRIAPNELQGWERKSEAAKEWPAATVQAPLGGSPWWQTPININLMPALHPLRISFWQTGWFQISVLSVFGVVILISLRLVAQLAMHRKEQWLLEQERARIARDIHDDLGSRMTRLVLDGEVAQSELPADSRTRLELEQICEQARAILSTLDEILWAVNPKRDTFQDFTSYVCGYAEEYLKSSGMQCLFDLDPAVSDVVLNLPLKRALLMGLKEALNNALKHSEATELVITLKAQAQKLSMAVSDNGKGFDPGALKPGRNGLANMAQRMRELDGACVIVSRPGEGCRTEFTIPLTPARWPARNWLGRWKRSATQLCQRKKSQTNEASKSQPAPER
jgi:signal transduction histidine kinase